MEERLLEQQLLTARYATGSDINFPHFRGEWIGPIPSDEIYEMYQVICKKCGKEFMTAYGRTKCYRCTRPNPQVMHFDVLPRISENYHKD